MMNNPTQHITDQIVYSLIDNPPPGCSGLVKFHDKKLPETGDISFPINPSIWENCTKTSLMCAEDNILSLKKDGEHDPKTKLQEHSQRWTYPLRAVKIINDRCALFLSRKRVAEVLLHDILIAKTFNDQPKDPNKKIHIAERTDFGDSSLSECRADIVNRTLRRVVGISEWTEVERSKTEDVLDVGVVSLTSNIQKLENHRTKIVKCGPVLDPQDGRLTKISGEEYLKLRSTDMRLMATHKYGVRVKDKKIFTELIEKLGKAAVTVDLLEVKVPSPVYMIRNSHGNTKGASFILYNSARLESLLRAFTERVAKGEYDGLPDLCDIDIGLLSNEDEWELMFVYLLGFRNVVELCIKYIDAGSFGLHHLIKYINGFVLQFSGYYSRIRILTERRKQLMPHLYARIYFLKAIREVFKTALALLEIEPIQFM